MRVFCTRLGHNAHICAGTNQVVETSLTVGTSKRSAALVPSLMLMVGQEAGWQRQMELLP